MSLIFWLAVGFFLLVSFFGVLARALQAPPSEETDRLLESEGKALERERCLLNLRKAFKFAQFWKVCAQVAFIISLVALYVKIDFRIPRSVGFIGVFLVALICLIGGERLAGYLGKRLRVPLSLGVLRSSLRLGWLGRLFETFYGLFPGTREPSTEVASGSSIDSILTLLTSARREGLISEEAMRMIEAILALGKTEVIELMAPRIEKVSLEGSMTVEEALGILSSRAENFIPVFETKPENVVGVVYLEDLLRESERASRQVRDLMHKPYFVPETKPVTELLREFKRERVHAALVLDEHGDVSGMISLDEISDFVFALAGGGPSEAELRLLGKGVAEMDGTVHVNEASEVLGVEIPASDEYETVAGYLLSRLGRIPKRGEEFEYDGIAFKVIDAEVRRIRRLRVEARDRRK